jgi:hypothetical protein
MKEEHLEEQTMHARLMLHTEQSQAKMPTECCIAFGWNDCLNTDCSGNNYIV